jgi:hypothetical protein
VKKNDDVKKVWENAILNLNIFLNNEAVVEIYLLVVTWIFVFDDDDDNGMEGYDICYC